MCSSSPSSHFISFDASSREDLSLSEALQLVTGRMLQQGMGGAEWRSAPSDGQSFSCFRSGEAVDAVRGVHRRESRHARRRELPRHGQRGGAHLTFWTPCMQHATTGSREYFGASWAGPPVSRAQQGAHAETEGTTSGLGWIHVRDSRAIGEYLGASSAGGS